MKETNLYGNIVMFSLVRFLLFIIVVILSAIVLADLNASYQSDDFFSGI